jgi:uncharacterized protein (DUF885 family)
MISRSVALAALLSTSLLIGGVGVQAQTATSPATGAVPAAETAHDRLFRLFKQSDEDNLRRNPIFGIFRGDLRYADQFGDYITDAYFAKEKAATEAELAALRAIPRDQLNATDQLAYDVFEYNQVQSLEGYEPRYFNVSVVRSTTSPASTPSTRPSPAARVRPRSRRSRTMRTTSSGTPATRCCSTGRSSASAKA